MSSDRDNLEKGLRTRKQRYVIDPFGVTSSVMAPSRPQIDRYRLKCDFCQNRYEKHYIMKHMDGCKKESDLRKNHDIRGYMKYHGQVGPMTPRPDDSAQNYYN